jgi:hypothetical protein
VEGYWLRDLDETIKWKLICNEYCDMLPSNASVIYGFWSLYLDLLDKSPGGITINDNTLNLTVITLR